MEMRRETMQSGVDCRGTVLRNLPGREQVGKVRHQLRARPHRPQASVPSGRMRREVGMRPTGSRGRRGRAKLRSSQAVGPTSPPGRDRRPKARQPAGPPGRARPGGVGGGLDPAVCHQVGEYCSDLHPASSTRGSEASWTGGPCGWPRSHSRGRSTRMPDRGRSARSASGKCRRRRGASTLESSIPTSSRCHRSWGFDASRSGSPM